MELPPLPDTHGLAVLLLVVVALALFTRERIPLETSSLAVLALLTAGFELFPYVTDGVQLHAIDFFSGFGHEALVAVCALMIAGQALVRTGALEPVGRQLARLWSISPMLSLLLTLLVGALLSAFVNNVPIVVLLLPILVSVSLRNNQPASSILMPMGFATLVGGMSTTIGTSTNLLVVSVASDMGLPRFSMFHFFLPAAIAGGLAILFLWLVAPRMLPRREALMEDTSPRVFTAQLQVEEESAAAGKTLAEVNEAVGRTLKVTQIRRNGGVALTPLPDVLIKPGDRLSVRDTPDNLKEIESVLGVKLYTGETRVDDEHPLRDEEQQLAEIVVTQGSPLEGATLSRLHFTDHYQLVTLALHQAGATTRTLREEVGSVRMNVGDVLLVQGSRERIAELKRSGELLVLDATSDLPTTKRAPLALLIMAAIVTVAAFGLLPIAISATCGVLLLIITRCLSWRDAAQALSTQVILIVVASLALGMALSRTGGAEYLAQLFVGLTTGSSPTVMLSGLMLVMAVLTNIVSNNAAAVIGTPIAVSIAQQLGLPAEPFVLAVLFGANMSYATPMAYKTNLLVMNAGGYKFNDFVRVGIPLTLIVWLALSWLLPLMYEIG
ncbi:SLC13 family permease [Sedimenticola thiotaurini]|uniref:Transporter n=1 Tax=Sedimenticola thiotaurini TaxID=1543721 RepID=A0A0F7JZR7_9GAMM|nr:SLC13 family permease [Sedimenticola thiotaurini]AKH21836.1 transporter [Sedimenticola thiotaurini]